MWKRNQRNHCDDDVLLAFVDGELGSGEKSLVAAHLSECWECRGRLDELDETARTLALLAAEDVFGGPDRAATAMASFLGWRREFERQLVLRQDIVSRFRSLWAWVVAPTPQLGRRLFRNVVALAAFPVIALSALSGWYFAWHSTVRPPVAVTIASATAPVHPSVPPAPRIDRPPLASPLVQPGRIAPLVDARPRVDQMHVKEIAVLYALHRVRACVEEPIEVLRRPEGDLLVHGFAATEERKAELLAVLGEMVDSRRLTTDIKTASDLASTPFDTGEQTAQPVPAVKPDRDESRYIRDGLERHFSENGREEAARLAIDFANRAVHSSDSLMSEAWALRRLTDRYRASGAQNLSPQSLSLLEVMVQDHLAALKKQVAAMATALDPLFTVGPPSLPLDTPGDATKLEERKTGIVDVFEAAHQIRGHTLGLFADAGLPRVLAKDGIDARAKTPAETLRDLRTALTDLHIAVRIAEEQVAVEFSRRHGLAGTQPQSEIRF